MLKTETFDIFNFLIRAPPIWHIKSVLHSPLCTNHQENFRKQGAYSSLISILCPSCFSHQSRNIKSRKKQSIHL